MIKWRYPCTTFRQTYGSWVNMRQRCTNEKHPQYADYGGRGISVCREWLKSWDAFYEDMGDREIGKTLDRIDNNGNYEPGNCRWVSMSIQNRNNRKTHFISFNGKTQPLLDWARELGFTPQGIQRRLNTMPIEQALSAPRSRLIVAAHGTLAMYTRHRCRCDMCRNTWREYQRNYNRRKSLEYDL